MPSKTTLPTWRNFCVWTGQSTCLLLACQWICNWQEVVIESSSLFVLLGQHQQQQLQHLSANDGFKCAFLYLITVISGRGWWCVVVAAAADDASYCRDFGPSVCCFWNLSQVIKSCMVLQNFLVQCNRYFPVVRPSSFELMQHTMRPGWCTSQHHVHPHHDNRRDARWGKGCTTGRKKLPETIQLYCSQLIIIHWKSPR